MRRLPHLAARFWFDAGVLVLLGSGVAVAVVDQNHKDGPEGPLWFDILAVVGFTTPMLFRRRFPVGAPVTVGVVVAGAAVVDGRLAPDNFIAYLSGLVACGLFGMLPKATRSLAGLLFVIGVAAVVIATDPKGNWADISWNAITFSVAWAIGFGIGAQDRNVDRATELALRAEREREEQAALAVTEERARIARELHDVVGHSVSVMTVQASAVRRLLEPDQVKENEALLVVEQTGREALAEMRRMVGVLRTSSSTPAADR